MSVALPPRLPPEGEPPPWMSNSAERMLAAPARAGQNAWGTPPTCPPAEGGGRGAGVRPAAARATADAPAGPSRGRGGGGGGGASPPGLSIPWGPVGMLGGFRPPVAAKDVADVRVHDAGSWV